MTTANYKIKAVNSDRDFCECCGKSGISRVVWVENTETGEVKHYGVVCAQNPEKGFDVKEVRRAIKSWENDFKNSSEGKRVFRESVKKATENDWMAEMFKGNN